MQRYILNYNKSVSVFFLIKEIDVVCAGKSQHVDIVVRLKYLGTALADQNYMHEDILR